MTYLRLPKSLGKRLYDWARGRPGGLVALALAVGLGAGIGAILFRYLIEWFTVVFTGHTDYGGAGREPNPFVPWMGILVRRPRASRGRPPLRTAHRVGSPGGSGPRGSRGHAGGRREGRAHSPSGGLDQVGGVRSLHRRWRIRGPRRPDRADRVSDRFGTRAGFEGYWSRAFGSWLRVAPLEESPPRSTRRSPGRCLPWSSSFATSRRSPSAWS